MLFRSYSINYSFKLLSLFPNHRLEPYKQAEVQSDPLLEMDHEDIPEILSMSFHRKLKLLVTAKAG